MLSKVHYVFDRVYILYFHFCTEGWDVIWLIAKRGPPDSHKALRQMQFLTVDNL